MILLCHNRYIWAFFIRCQASLEHISYTNNSTYSKKDAFSNEKSKKQYNICIVIMFWYYYWTSLSFIREDTHASSLMYYTNISINSVRQRTGIRLWSIMNTCTFKLCIFLHFFSFMKRDIFKNFFFMGNAKSLVASYFINFNDEIKL